MFTKAIFRVHKRKSFALCNITVKNLNIYVIRHGERSDFVENFV